MVCSDGVDLHCVERGGGEQTVIFSHSYLADHTHFEPQIAALEDRFRVIAFDHRDHGRSAQATRPYTIDDLVADGVAVIEHFGAAPCHWVGLSTGGFIGVRLALRHRSLLRSVTLIDTSAEREPLHKRAKYRGMFAALPLVGIRPMLGTAMRSMFGKSSFSDPSKASLLNHWRQRFAANDPQGLVRFGRAIFGRDDVSESLRSVDIPALVIAGAEDVALPLRRSERLAEVLRAPLEIIEDAGHLSTVEQPDAVSAALTSFLERQP